MHTGSQACLRLPHFQPTSTRTCGSVHTACDAQRRTHARACGSGITLREMPNLKIGRGQPIVQALLEAVMKLDGAFRGQARPRGGHDWFCFSHHADARCFQAWQVPWLLHAAAATAVLVCGLEVLSRV